MKILFSFALGGVFLFFIMFSQKVHASENEYLRNNSQKIIANKYAEKFCNAKDDHFFEGLESEKTLKYSYFRYIGFQSKEIHSKDMYKPLINQIRKKCIISKEEERELNEFFLKESESKTTMLDKSLLTSRYNPDNYP